MWSNLPLFPERASRLAGQVDALYFFLVGVAAFFSGLIFFLIFYFAVKFRRRAPNEIPEPVHGNLFLEALWIGVPLALVIVMFTWGYVLFSRQARVPENAVQMFAVGKQWMWKFQHPQGRREINELHVPLGRAVRMTMASEDVIHSLYVPVFRMKMDVVPGRYTHLWFEPTREGTYHLFCAEYCGTKHSQMTGRVVVMRPERYEQWLESSGETLQPPEARGAELFQSLGCVSCHQAQSNQRGPVLARLYGSRVRLADGRSVAADERYIRESIVDPRKKVVAGYAPIMPTYQGQVGEDDLLQLVAYIKSLDESNAP